MASSLRKYAAFRLLVFLCLTQSTVGLAEVVAKQVTDNPAPKPCESHLDVACQQLEMGVKAFREAHFDQALVYFQRAAILDPQFLRARLYLATAYAQQYIPGGESEDNIELAKKAIQAFQEVLRLDSKNLTAIASIGQLYYNMKEFNSAKEYQRRRAQIDPANPESYYWIGVIDWATCYPRRMKLREDLSLKTPPDPKKPDLLPPLPEEARVKLAAENGPLVEEAIEAFQKTLELKPDDLDAMAYLNLTYREKADLEVDMTERDIDLKAADTWVQRALEVRKKAAEKAMRFVRESDSSNDDPRF